MSELKQKILVVDDEPCIRKLLQTLLEVDGFDVEAVSSGEEALTKINNGERPDVIILNVLMPEMNGLEALGELMRLDRSLNVIMHSCSNELNTIAEALRLGARDYLAIFYEKAKLDEALLRATQRKQDSDEDLPSSIQVALASLQPCSTDPPWSTRVGRRKTSSNEWVVEFLSPERPRCFCDASRPEWKAIVDEWKDRKRLYLWLCEQHAVTCGFW
jgi:CheY-like chemotaxis protein